MNTHYRSKGRPTAAAYTRNILETAAANGNFTVFGKAIELAGLGEVLRGPGPFTVLAPTDTAFSRLPAGKLDSLLREENRAELTAILNYHVMTGRKSAAELGQWDSARTVHGQAAPMKLDGKQLSIDGAQVTFADIGSSNGVIHAIDKVNIPATAPQV